MTLDISAIRQRIEKADFFDDWEQDGNRIRNSRGTVAVCPTPQNQGTFSCQQIATLLAHAPADLRALCDEVERLRARLNENWAAGMMTEMVEVYEERERLIHGDSAPSVPMDESPKEGR